MNWKPFEKYGLLIVELHSIDPQKTQLTWEKTMTAYVMQLKDTWISIDTEYENFLEEAKKAGLKPEKT